MNEVSLLYAQLRDMAALVALCLSFIFVVVGVLVAAASVINDLVSNFRRMYNTKFNNCYSKHQSTSHPLKIQMKIDLSIGTKFFGVFP